MTKAVGQKLSPAVSAYLTTYLIEKYANEGPSAIAKQFGISVTAVRARARRLGLYYDTSVSDSLTAAIIARYPTEGAATIAAEFGLPPANVRQRAKIRGVKLLPEVRKAQRSVQKRAQSAARNPEATGFFRAWSPDMAYVLGYTWADGSVNPLGRIVYVAKTQDESILEYVRRVLSPRTEITRQAEQIFPDGVFGRRPRVGTSTRSPQSRLTVCSVLAMEDVRALGIPPAKSFTDPALPSVPALYLADFVRGVFDGDGYFRAQKPGKNGRTAKLAFGLCGTDRAMLGLRELIQQATGCGAGTTLMGSPKCRRVEWAAREDVRKICDWMYYPGHPFSLARKKIRADTYLSTGRALLDGESP